MAVEKTQTELSIINDIISGDKKKYELLIRKYNQRLYRVAKSILWQEEEVEDAMQEAYIKAYQQLSQFEYRASFSTWLTRILINECLMKQRKNKSASQIYGELNDDHMKQSVDAVNPEKKVINSELKTLLENAISLLPEKYRIIFIMREVENMSVTETTKVLNITETNVKVRLSRSKDMIRTSLISSYPVNELLDFNLTRCDRIVDDVFARI